MVEVLTRGGVVGSSDWLAGVIDQQSDERAQVLDDQAMGAYPHQIAVRSLELMSLEPGQSVLEVGCGTGDLLPALAGLVGPGGQVVGIDVAEASLDQARERIAVTGVEETVTVQVADAHRLPFADATFAAARVERVLVHLADPDAALREMCRVVRPGGWVVAVEPDAAGIRIDHAEDPETVAQLIARGKTAVRNPDIGLELNRRMARAGLVDRRIEVFTEFHGTYSPAFAAADREAAYALVAEGTLTAERAEAALAALADASTRGEYSRTGSTIVAVGRVPHA